MMRFFIYYGILFLLPAIYLADVSGAEVPRANLSGALDSLQQRFTELGRQLPGTVPEGKKVTKIDEATYRLATGQTIHLIKNKSIVDMRVDAIVNAANKTLMKSPGGIAGVIWQAAGADQLNKWIEENIGKQGTELIATQELRSSIKVQSRSSF